MNYGFDTTDWPDRWRQYLGTELTDLLVRRKMHMAYVEIDGLYPGRVTMRSLTRYLRMPAVRDNFAAEADEIYDTVTLAMANEKAHAQGNHDEVNLMEMKEECPQCEALWLRALEDHAPYRLQPMIPEPRFPSPD